MLHSRRSYRHRSLSVSPHLIVAVFAAFAVGATTLHAQTPRIQVLPARPLPGALVRLTLDGAPRGGDSVINVTGTLAGERLHFVAAGGDRWRALGAVPIDGTDKARARVLVERASGAVDTVRTALDVPALPEPSITASPQLAVPDRFTRPLDSATQARIARENALARAVGTRAHESPARWTRAFLKPRTSRVTSQFGTGRAFNGAVASRHLGVDFAGPVGAPIKAANRGVVALVDTFFLAGRVIYIDHGAGVVTGYFHLSEPLVAVGDTVSRGQVIGRVGSTGRVTGPHLHWTARFGTLTMDPLDLVELEQGWYRSPADTAARTTSATPAGTK